MAQERRLTAAGAFCPNKECARFTHQWRRATSSSMVVAGGASSVTTARAVKAPSPPREAPSFSVSVLL
jgi:hypothetical protein